MIWTLTFLSKAEGVPPVLLRAFLGFSFFAVHGLGKVRPAGWDWGQGFVGGVTKMMGDGAPPAAMLYVAAWTEFLGGFALLVGLLTRWAALGLCFTMAGAALIVHGGQGFRAHITEAGHAAGYEMAAVYTVACLALALVGPGSLSLDRLFFGKAALTTG